MGLLLNCSKTDTSTGRWWTSTKTENLAGVEKKVDGFVVDLKDGFWGCRRHEKTFMLKLPSDRLSPPQCCIS